MPRGLRGLTTPVKQAWVQPGNEPRVIRGITYLLLAFGLAAVFSASTVQSLNTYGNAWTIFLKQLIFAVLGVFLMRVADRVPLLTLRRLAPASVAVVLVLLMAVLVIGATINGQKNWIPLGPVTMQPSEFAKLAFVIFAAERAATLSQRTRDPLRIGAPILMVACLMMALVVLEKDMGNVLVMAGILLAILFTIGYPARRLGALALGGLVIVALALKFGSQYRLARILNWLNPYADPQGLGWQWIHGNYAMAVGGFLGQGPGASKEKWGALPEAHTDFILAVIGEEYGFVGTCITIGLLLAVLILLIRVALRLGDDPFRQVIMVGVAAWLFMQSAFNIGAVVGLLPIVGVTLPLVSYGGSSLLPLLVALGIVIRCLREPQQGEVRA